MNPNSSLLRLLDLAKSVAFMVAAQVVLVGLAFGAMSVADAIPATAGVKAGVFTALLVLELVGVHYALHWKSKRVKSASNP